MVTRTQSISLVIRYLFRSHLALTIDRSYVYRKVFNDIQKVVTVDGTWFVRVICRCCRPRDDDQMNGDAYTLNFAVNVFVVASASSSCYRAKLRLL